MGLGAVWVPFGVWLCFMRHFFVTYWKTACCCIVIAVLSLVTFSPSNLPKVPHSDKLVHAAMYFALSLALCYELWQQRLLSAKTLLVTFLFATGYGGLMELCQSLFTQTRAADWYDFAANAVGSGLLCGCASLFLHKRL